MASARSSAWGWIAPGAAVLVLVWIAWKMIQSGAERDVGPQGSGAGGITGWLARIFGGRQRNENAGTTSTSQDAAGPDHETGGMGAQGVTGRFAIASGDAVNRELFAGTVRVPLSLVNSGPSEQTVLVQIHTYWDFLIQDNETTWEELVTVAGLSGAHVEADLGIPSNGIILREAQLFLDLTVAGVHQDRIEHVQVT